VSYTNVKNPLVTKNGVPYNLQYDLKTGNVQIIQQNAPAGTKPIYQDGKWNASATELGFADSEKTQLHQQTIVAVQAAYNSVGGVNSGSKLPQWATKSFTNGTPGQTSVTPSNSTSGTSGGGGIGENFGILTSALLNPTETLKNVSVNGGNFGLSNESDLFATPMKYPVDLMTPQQDHLVITMYSYKPPNQQALFGGGSQGGLVIAASGIQKNTTLESKIGTVILPMPQSVSDNNAVSWGRDEMSNMAAAVTANTMTNVASQGATAAVAGMAGGILGMGFKSAAAAALQTSNLFKLLTDGKISPELASLATSDVTSKMVKMQGYGVESESILARGAGIVPNSNLELLFSGPELRSFSFSYRLSPRSAEEAAMVRRIIRFFKQGMAAKKQRGKSGQASFFLGAPNVFRLEYRNGTKAIDGVNKFKTCALTSFSCNYTPEGLWAAYDSGQPVSTVFTMAFNELEPIYDTDYQSNNIFSGRDDLSSVSNGSVGY
jgi:hypothetical protein